MKKPALFLISLSLMVATGCNKQSDILDDTQKDLQVSENNLRMVQLTWNENSGEEQPTVRTLTITPEDGAYAVEASTKGIVNVKVTGNQLQLTAMNVGTTRLTITDTVTLKTAECQVEVFSVVETLTFPYASVSYQFRDWDRDSYTLLDSAFNIPTENGDTIFLRAYVVDATLTLFSEGFYLKDEAFQGADIGYTISFPATAYYAPAGLNTDRGVAIPLTYEAGVWSTAQSTAYHKLQAGKLDTERESEAIAHVSTAIAATNSNTEAGWNTYYYEMYLADSLAFHGALMRKYVRVANGYSTTPLPCALVNAGAVNLATGGQTPSRDMFEVKEAIMYINPLLGYYGLGVNLEYDATRGWYNASKHFEIGKTYHYTYPVPSN